MTSQTEILNRLTVKTERADKHIFELTERIRSFQESGPYTFLHKDDLDTGERTVYVHFVKGVPTDLSAIIGDALQNLRSALDHLATHLVTIGATPRVKKPYYPIFESAEKYETEKMGKIEGMRPEAIKAIDATEPYPRGNGWILWDLHTMNNRDKHRLLIPVWGNLISHTFPRSEKEKLEKILKKDFPGGMGSAWLKAAPGPSFLKDSDKLLTLPIAEFHDHMDFRINISFGEPEAVKGKPVIETLKSMSNLVRKIISDFYDGGLL